MNNFIEKFPFYYIILIFIGYIDFYSFYIHFNIEIHKYLTLSEYVISFLPFSIQILLILFIVFVVVPIRKIKNAKASFDKGEVPYDFFYSTKILFDKNRSVKSSNRLFKIVFSIEFLFVILVGIGILLSFYFVIENFFISTPRFCNIRILMTMIWIVFIVMIIPISIYIKNRFNDYGLKIYPNTRLILFTLYFVIIISTINYYKADRIKSGYSNQNVTFEFDGKKVESNKSLVYIGMTENYLFLHDLKENKNQIFQRKDILKITFFRN